MSEHSMAVRYVRVMSTRIAVKRSDADTKVQFACSVWKGMHQKE